MAETGYQARPVPLQRNNNGRLGPAIVIGSQAITFDFGLPWYRGGDGEQREVSMKSQLWGDSQILASVSDTGVGLPIANADSIFDAFFTSTSQGAGLRLAITRSIVASHGGRIWASANSGAGERFILRCPLGTRLLHDPRRFTYRVDHRRRSPHACRNGATIEDRRFAF